MAVYLDYNASAPINPHVLNVMMNAYKNYIGNADSRTHDHGARANIIVSNARQQVADLLGVRRDEVFFTSGSTESNNIAIQGLRKYGLESNKKHIITTSIEHKAVLETAKSLREYGFDVEIINPDRSGRVKAKDVLSRVRKDTLLVSIMHVNNETGIIQPVEEIGEALFEKDVYFHIDATQSCGKLVDEIRKLKYDMLSLSAHKLEGPQGVGALILKKKNYKIPPIKPIMYGGSQEHGIRPGTTPVALVAGLGACCEMAAKNYQENELKAAEIKQAINHLIEDSNLRIIYNGDQNHCVSTTVNICIKGVNSEALMLASKNYCSISNGSACTSYDYSPSYVLRAMGLPDTFINNSIRVSWGSQSEKEDVVKNFSHLLSIAEGLVF